MFRVIANLARLSHRRAKGQALVLISVLLPVVLGMAGLAIDAANAMQTRTVLQSAADAGALAGARDLPAAPSTAASDARTWATHNRVGSGPGDSVTTAVTSTYNTNDTITVTVRRTKSTIFLSVLGIGTYDVTATATAIHSPARSCDGATPWAVNSSVAVDSQSRVVFGRAVRLEPADQSNQNGNYGNFISLTPPGQPYADAIANGLASTVHIGDSLPTQVSEAPQISATTAAALNARIAARPLETWNSFGIASPRVLLFPTLLNNAVANVPMPVTIQACLAFFVESVGQREIFGRFVSFNTTGVIGPGTPDTGVYVVKLIR